MWGSTTFLAALPIVIAGACNAGAVTITELLPTALESFVESHHPYAVIYVYATWCHVCTTFTPVFERVASEFPDVAFAKLNGGEHRASAVTLVDDGLPGLALYRNGNYIDYMRGILTAHTVRQWITQHTGPDVRIFPSLSEATKQATLYDVAFVGSFQSLESSEAKTFREFAGQHRSWGVYIGVENAALPLKTEISVTHKDEPTETLHNIVQLSEWMSAHRFPLFGEMHGGNQKEYYEAGKDPIVFLGSRSDMEQRAKTFRAVAQRFRETHHVVWMDTDRKEHRQLPSALHVDLPGCVVFSGTGNRRNHQQYVFPTNDSNTRERLNSVDAIADFVKKIMAHEVRPVIRSQGDGAEASNRRKFINIITGNNFESKVLQSQKDVLLILTAPRGGRFAGGCNYCDSVLDGLNAVVPKLKSVLSEASVPEFGEFLVVGNEFPVSGWGGTWTLQDLPVLYFVEPGTNVPIEKHQVKDIASVLTFWQQHTQRVDPQHKKILSQLLSNRNASIATHGVKHDEL